MTLSKKNIIIFDSGTFPNGFILKLKKTHKKFKFLILKDNEIKKLYSNIENANALINCPRKYFNDSLYEQARTSLQ